jgi:ethanolamine ammonia-lyase large subunit
MVCRHAIDATAYGFNDLRDLQAKATPPRSGDRLPETPKKAARGLLAASGRRRVATVATILRNL